jgi:hypothetical protein
MGTLQFDEPDDQPESLALHYFIDEAGQPKLFGRRRESTVGQEGCSTYFLLGKLDIDDPEALASDLNELRTELLADPYFKGVPSMQPEEKKTARFFHAKDDLPEVRYQVFRLLRRHEMTFYAVVRDKHRVVDQVLKRNKEESAYWYNENHLYDQMVASLFDNRFHRGDHFNICFARRGEKDRTAALTLAIERAKEAYQQAMGFAPRTTTKIWASSPQEQAGLQAVDYFLWALQRLYERGEDRYWEVVSPKVGNVHDADDDRKNSWGVHYSKGNHLTLTQVTRAKKS